MQYKFARNLEVEIQPIDLSTERRDALLQYPDQELAEQVFNRENPNYGLKSQLN